MNTKPKNKSTGKRNESDFTLIELRKTTVAKLKALQSKLYSKDGKFSSYDKIVNSLIN